MHTLLIHQAFATPDNPGGTRHFELAQQVLANGDDFTIVASNRSYQTGKAYGKPKLLQRETYGRLRVLRAYTPATLHQSFAWRIVAFLGFMITSVWAGLQAGPVDLVMGTTPPIFQALSAWLVAFLRRRPFLLEVRDLWPEFAVDMGVLTNPVLIKLARLLESFLYWRADHILVNSPAYRDYMLRRGIEPNKVSLIPNGVDPAMFDPALDGAALRTQWNVEGKFVATYAGALGLANDLPVILNAASLLRENTHIRFVFVGDGKERPALEKMADAMGLANVHFAGSVPKSHMRDVLAASDVCLATLQNIPMFKTTYPNKVFDYMAAGRPTILAIDGVIRDVVEKADGGLFVQPGDAQQLALAVLALSTNPAVCAQMGRSAREYVVTHFDRAAQAERFVALLARVAHKG